MDKEYLQNVYDYLNDQYKEYCLTNKTTLKRAVEDKVRAYSNHLKEDLYLFLNEDHGSGLFRSGFFESDLSRSLKKLKDALAD